MSTPPTLIIVLWPSTVYDETLLGGPSLGDPRFATQAQHDWSAGKAAVVIVANCDENRAGLSDTAKRPESEGPAETAGTTGCGRSRDVVTFVRERARS